ncbi:MAG: TIGR00266 family protein [Candidatus Methanomethylophilaceae archaeon]
MKYTITGDNLQFANVQFEPGEDIYSEAGAMVYMTGNVTMKTTTKGGALKGLRRMISGESFFLTSFETQGGRGIVGFGGSTPGKILDLKMEDGNWLVQRSSFLAAEGGVAMDLAFQKKMGSIFFGGEGLVLQKLSGKGTAFIHASGDFNIVDLKPGQVYKISTSKVVGWEEGVKYDITTIGGVKNALFGGEGLFVTTLTGPGKIVIQSMSLADLAAALYPYMPQPNR